MPQSKNTNISEAPEPNDPKAHSKGGPKAKPLQSGLYLVATPIGNARDMTLRALDILHGADIIACEDTRITGKLTSLYDISTPLLSYHEHNAEKVRPKLIKQMKNGEIVALVSDAGTPLISDPGYKLVQDCRDQGLMVTSAPGASSVLTGLQLSGLPTDRFMFVGFLPVKKGARCRALNEVAGVDATLVFLESAKRLAASLADMALELGPREAAVTRELTKLYEEVRTGSLEELAAHYEEAGAPKGEIVIVVSSPTEEESTEEDIDTMIIEALSMGSVKDAASMVAVATGIPKRVAYQRTLELAKSREDD
ncbi:MAG: 16S rRNA (cytidine(1402)-2'-O)-methyltransferase [Rhodospirillales bacterium]|nr:16S rRNA (cytidine(1402)-2'-O)-methyltransferase [Rhodospirillales bacterium]